MDISNTPRQGEIWTLKAFGIYRDTLPCPPAIDKAKELVERASTGECISALIIGDVDAKLFAKARYLNLMGESSSKFCVVLIDECRYIVRVAFLKELFL